jgi:hypothetical protein
MKRLIVKLFFVSFFILFSYGSLIAQTDWNNYPDNPVLLTGFESNWDNGALMWPYVIFDDVQFIMYYGGGPSSFNPLDSESIGIAYSNDGISWTKYEDNPVLTAGLSGEWDDFIIDPGPVFFDGEEYKMWYSGFDGLNWRIGLATSQDGIDWAKYEGNPVLDLGDSGQWDDSGVRTGVVLYHEEVYKLWYVGDDGEQMRLGYATSLDGINWTIYDENPVLDNGNPGNWDDTMIAHCYVINNGNTYEMWYQGSDESIGFRLKMGYATSIDGVTWSKFNDNPIMNARVGSILLDGGVYRMWSEISVHIGYAEDFSNIAHSDSLALNCNYVRPTQDTVLVSAWVQNPNDQDITVRALIANEDSVLVDSTDLTDQGGGLWQGWTLPQDEGIYHVWIETTDEESETIHNGLMWRNEIFCTSGPVQFDKYEINSADTIPNPGDYLQFNLYLKNNGKTATVTDVSLHATKLDTFVTQIVAFQDPEYGDIAPGEVAEPHRHISVRFNENFPDSIYTRIKVDIKSGDHIFWTDTLSIFVQHDPLGLQNHGETVPLVFGLNQNYPNPFNPTTIISYQLPVTSEVNLSIYNLLGQKVVTLVNEQKQAGSHQVDWDASGFASGVYYYRIEVVDPARRTGEFIEVKKMVLIR